MLSEGGDILQVVFSPYHSGQWSIFLWFLSNAIWKRDQDVEGASAVYYLNKALNGVDWYYECCLPDIFFVEHPIGSVLGRANYGNYLSILQGVTIGGVKKNGTILYPKIGKFVTMYANSSVLGECKIGDYVMIGAGATVKNQDIPNYSIVFGNSPDLIIKRKNPVNLKEEIHSNWILE